MSNCLDNVNKRKLKLFVRKLCKKRKAVTDNSKKRKPENAEKKKKLSHKRLNWYKDFVMR